MNTNHPLFKQIHKISRKFGAKPMFLDYDMKEDKPFLRPYKKYKDDCLDLIFVKGIPILSICRLSSATKSTKMDCLFYNNKFKLYSLIDKEGILQAVLEVKNNKVSLLPYNDDSDNKVIIYDLSDIYEVVEQIKQKNKNNFYFE